MVGSLASGHTRGCSMTWALIGLAALATSACVVKFDYGNGVLSCEQDGLCPAGTTCIDGVCRGEDDPPPIATPDGAPPAPDATATPDAGPGAPDATLTQTITRSIAQSTDDAEEDLTNNVVDLASDDLELTRQANDQVIGMRFVNMTIPQGATIVSASVQFQVDETSAETTQLTIAGQADDDPVAFVGLNTNVSARPLTAASVAWNPAAWNTIGDRGADQLTPDLSSVVQELVNRPGWVQGGAMVLLINGTGRRVARSFDSPADRMPAELTVEFVP